MIALSLLVISSIIGAGFATGAELLAFFGGSSVSPIITAGLFGVFLFLLMAIIVYLVNCKFNPPTYIFVPIYFAFFVALTAGMVALIGIFPTIVALCLCIVLVVFGFDKLMRLNTLIIGFVIVVLLWTVMGSFELGSSSFMLPSFGLLGSALFYAGMNCMLFPVIKAGRDRFSFRKVLGACGIACGVLTVLVFLMLSSIDPNSSNPMPILDIADNIFVKAAIFLSIFSSQFISLFNLDSSVRLKQKTTPSDNRKLSHKKFRVVKLVVISVVGFGFSLIGFQTLVGTLYPLVGIFMTLFLLCAFVICWTHRRILLRRNSPDQAPEISSPPT